ncbi:MAG: DUF924 family protein [Pseudomonadales bacterium]|jgi:uncharacterized protein (DUF924 family)|nr:DUF924 family protein [Pseudomonadales bacterium]MDP6470705.1 DUF924 family protein [Pseudomonadales bacterium]MDP6828343.1 DUF924 family protein [Pseudomonadales bacterium]MDP6972107.1 DUF924 family protein [Pseudomonadales bacterium]
MSDAAPDRLLEFWFGTLEKGFADQAHRQRWFSPAEAFDSECRGRFGFLIDAVCQGDLQHWLHTSRGTLAYILVCDQLPRNVHRGTAAAFANDALALSAARRGVNARADIGLTFDERSFFYMPFEHSESVIDQHASVGLFTKLRDETPPGDRQLTGGSLRHAHGHRDIILRFGRFPHRNQLLGRQSSTDEMAHLAQGHHFGQ